MKNFYEINMKCITNRCFIPESSIKTGKYTVEQSKENVPTVKINNDSKSVYMHSKYSPSKEAEKWVNSIDFKSDSILICFGFGFAYHIKELLKRFTENNKIFIYEPDEELFYTALENVDLTELLNDSRVYICVGDMLSKFTAFVLDNIPKEATNKIKTIKYNDYDKFFNNEYAEFLKVVRDTILILVVDKNTICHYAENWTKNLACNIKEIINSYNIADFKDIVKGKPVVVVSAGPSLDKNVEQLKRIKGKILIISAFTAVSNLISHGIKPDIIVTTDVIQTDPENSFADIPVLYIPITSYGTMLAFKGPKIVCPSMVEKFTAALLNKYKKEIHFTAVGGSVACTAVDAAVMMGASAVILIGQDLAYPNNKIHADKYVFDETFEELSERKELIEVEDIYGNRILSDSVMKSYILWFENYIESCDRLFIDATEGGALIKGTKIMTFSAAIDEYCNISDNIDLLLDSVFKKGTIFNDDERLIVLKELLKFTDFVLNMKKEFDTGIKLSEKLVKYCKFSTNQKEIRKIVEKLDNIENEFISSGYIQKLYSLMLQTVSYENAHNDNENYEYQAALKNLKLYQTFYKTNVTVNGYLFWSLNEVFTEKIKDINNIDEFKIIGYSDIEIKKIVGILCYFIDATVYVKKDEKLPMSVVAFKNIILVNKYLFLVRKSFKLIVVRRLRDAENLFRILNVVGYSKGILSDIADKFEEMADKTTEIEQFNSIIDCYVNDYLPEVQNYYKLLDETCYKEYIDKNR